MCPEGSFSTIWFMTKEDQYTNCECDSSCILLSNCAFFNANNYTSPIQRISENLENTPDYQPGNTYYFTSFSVNLKTLSNPSGNRSGGECVSEMLRLIVEVQSAEDSKPSPSPKPTFEATPTEATEATEAPEVGSAAESGDGKPIDPGDKDKPKPDVVSLPLTPSSSLPLSLISPLTLLATALLAHLTTTR
jgi:hypothetical protein